MKCKISIPFKCNKCGKKDLGFFGQKYCHGKLCLKKTKIEKICESCNKSFSSTNNQKIYCSRNCRIHLPNYGYSASPWKKLGINAGNIGAMHELKVCYDLILRGYEVFRSQSPCASCDLIILDNGAAKRVEVKTGHYMKGGKLSFKEREGFKPKRYDVMAIVTPGEIIYRPFLQNTPRGGDE